MAACNNSLNISMLCDLCMKSDHLGFIEIFSMDGCIALSVWNTTVKVSRENSNHKLSYDNILEISLTKL